MTEDQFYITNPELEQYAEKYSTGESLLLRRIYRETHLHCPYPQMLSGHLQGAFLSMISTMLKPERILEIGTFTGYSAICLAEGLTDTGELITIDNNPEIKDTVLSYFKESGFGNRIKLWIGNAAKLVPEVEAPIDLAFIDADKENYISYYEIILSKMPRGGIILADNAFWYGRVLNAENSHDSETIGIHAFNKYIQDDTRVENLLLPLRDGLMMIRKR
jgi:caffeoyl-CoA O-methyltransferase